jgi:hypothetical protein
MKFGMNVMTLEAVSTLDNRNTKTLEVERWENHFPPHHYPRSLATTDNVITRTTICQPSYDLFVQASLYSIIKSIIIIIIMLVYRQNQVYSAEKSDLLSSLNN